MRLNDNERQRKHLRINGLLEHAIQKSRDREGAVRLLTRAALLRNTMNLNEKIYGLIAEFKGDEEVLTATRAAYDRGYRKMDAFAPFPVEGLPEALGRKRTAIPVIVFAGGAFGCLGGYLLQWYAMTVSYPLNIGGRPLNSWPMFIPITFELTILSAAFAAIIGMLVLNKLPLPHHPLFNVPEFERASSDKFFLCIQADDPKFDLRETRRFLEMLKPESIAEVPAE